MFRTGLKDDIKGFLEENSFFNRNKDKTERITFSYYDDLCALSVEYPDRKYLEIEFRHLEIYNRELAQELIDNPAEFFKQATIAIAEIPVPLEKELTDIELRVTDLPSDYEVSVSELRAEHVGKFLQLKGMVVRASFVRPDYLSTAYICLRCGHVNIVYQSRDAENLIEPFAGCENETCGKRGPFKLVPEQSEMFNHQYFLLQESLDYLNGKRPQTVIVSVGDTLTGLCQPGEKIVLTGILNTKFKLDKRGSKTHSLDFVFLANTLTKMNSSYEDLDITSDDVEKIKALSQDPDLKTKIVQSIAPAIYGLESVKEGLALQLFSGVRRNVTEKLKRRGDIHVLLVGDPGMAKSELMECMAEISPRCVQTSGRSSSGAGLTGSVVKDEFSQRWSVDAGAMTLAGDGGLCIVDEIEKMKARDRGAMHTALEQQKVNIAKAGLVAELPTVCSLLAAANPKNSRFDNYQSTISQITIDPALLSRMDLIFIMKDIPKESDLDLFYKIIMEKENCSRIIELDLLRKYIAYARMNIFPELTEEAGLELSRYCHNIRMQKGNQDTLALTKRTTQSLIRLTTANAKLRLSQSADIFDAREAIRLVGESLKDVGVDSETGQMDAMAIYNGMGVSQRERLTEIHSIIEELCKKDLGKYKSALIADVKSSALLNGITDSEVIIQKMRERGEIIMVDRHRCKLT